MTQSPDGKAKGKKPKQKAKRKSVTNSTLTLNQKKFCQLYAASGNGTEAAAKLGYKHPHVQASRMLSNDKVKNYLSTLIKPSEDNSIASAEERQRFWSDTMRNPAVKLTDRIKASEILGRAKCDFVERKIVTGEDGAPIQVNVTHVHNVNFVEAVIVNVVLKDGSDAAT